MRVRQIGNDRGTITVKTVDPSPDTITLRIVCESCGFYAVEYTENGIDKCGQFVDMEDQQELYEEREDAKFYGDNANYLVIQNGDGFKWSEISE